MGGGKGEGEECDGHGGMSLVPAPHQRPVVLQDQCRILRTKSRMRWATCNADRPPVVSRACRQASQVVHPGWAIHRDHRGRQTALSGTVPHGTAHVMARACCWMSPCRVVVVLTRLLRSFLRPSQHLLRLCSSPGTIVTLPLPRISPPRFFLSSCSCSSSSSSSSTLSRFSPSFLPERTLQSESRDPPPTASSHKPQPNNARSTACPSHGRGNGESGLAAPTGGEPGEPRNR